jgi:ribose-phosphate pyrophosphokinase
MRIVTPRWEHTLSLHAVFAPDALRVLKDAGAGQIVTCNTLPHETNAIVVTGDIAAAVQQLSGQRRAP